MLIRRYFRIKSLQFLYAQYLSKMDFKKVEQNMLHSIEELHYLYISLLHLILRIRDKAIMIKKNKILYTKNYKIIYNSILEILSNNKYLLKYKSTKNYNQILWKKQDEYILLLFNKMLKSELYQKYIEEKNSTFEKDQIFIIEFYKNFIIPNKKLISYIEDQYINGLFNLDIAHNMVCKTLQVIKVTSNSNFKLKNNYKNNQNQKFIINLYRNTILHKKEFNDLINIISNNWDVKRIAMIDLIILQMGICEFLYFPNIPPKVTMNEYIEITKIFGMEKSTIFVNGILDQSFKFLSKKNKILKKGKKLI